VNNFRNLKIWQKGMELVLLVYELANLLPTEEKYGLRSQITKAVISIPSNIAEGCSRSSDKDFKRFLEISLGSSFELETQLLIIEQMNLIDKDKLKHIKNLLNEEQKMINGFVNKLK